MLDKIQFLLSMQIIGLCVLGGIMMLLRSLVTGHDLFWHGV